MEESQKQSTYYYESSDGLSGPYQVAQVKNLFEAGVIIETTSIFDADNNTWTPCLQLLKSHNLIAPQYPNSTSQSSASKPSTHSSGYSSGFQLPPKPPEIRDLHVVELDLEKTQGADYFGLISDRKQELEERKKDVQARVERDKAALKTVSGGRTPTPPSFHTEVQGSSKPPVFQSKNSEAVTVDAKEDTLWNQLVEFYNENKPKFLIASSLVVVLIGTFFALKNFQFSKGRIPANKDLKTSKQNPSVQKKELSKNLPPTDSLAVDPLGQGKNPVSRSSGGVSSTFKPKVIEKQASPNIAGSDSQRVISPTPNPTTNQVQPRPTSADETARTPPQFYSSSEDQGNHPQGGNPNVTSTTTPTSNPNDGSTYPASPSDQDATGQQNHHTDATQPDPASQNSTY